MIIDPRFLVADPPEVTSAQRLIMARGNRILREANIERQGGTDVLHRPGRDELYRFGVLVGQKKAAEDAIAAVGLGKPFIVYERGRIKAL